MNAINKLKIINFSKMLSLQEDSTSAPTKINMTHKSRLMAKIGDRIFTIPTENIKYFFSENKITFIQVDSKRKYIVDYTLDELTHLLKPEQFFRVSRKHIINVEAITEIKNDHSRRWQVFVKDIHEDPIMVSRDRVLMFKKWLDGSY